MGIDENGVRGDAYGGKLRSCQAMPRLGCAYAWNENNYAVTNSRLSAIGSYSNSTKKSLKACVA
jgi:hypothetical protein